MNKNKNEESVGSKLADQVAEKPTKTLGRKRDHTRDAEILEATIDILAEAGFDGLYIPFGIYSLLSKVQERMEGGHTNGKKTVIFRIGTAGYDEEFGTPTWL